MNQELKSTKSHDRPSQGAVESRPGDVTDVGKSDAQRMDRIAMQGAKRAQNRIHNDEETTPGNTIFSK
jgi:hypothetical protein